MVYFSTNSTPYILPYHQRSIKITAFYAAACDFQKTYKTTANDFFSSTKNSVQLHNPEQIILQKAAPLDQQSTKCEM